MTSTPTTPARLPAPAAGSPTEPAETTETTEPSGNRSGWRRHAPWLLFAATGVLYVANLSANGYANSFYSAAAQAGSESWTALFYGSLDASNSITVDKPPASLWVMGLSVRAFGLSSWSILLPEVLMGVAAVAVVHATVRRHFGAGAGLIAGAVLALTPVAVLMFRFNNPDALLTLLMALGAWATLRAVERGSIRWFALVGVLVGLGFLTKSLQVLLVVPGFGLAWLLAADTTWRRRVLGAAAGIGAMVAAAGWWVAVVELVPTGMRPYIGGSQTDSFLELTFGYNGLGRLSGEETGSVGGGNGWGETGVGRMFGDAIGGQVSWLLPAALLLLVLGVAIRGRAARTDPRRAAYLAWGSWLLVTVATFSFMAGIFHEYYTVALAPAIAALVGMGAGELWEHRAGWSARAALAAVVLGTAAWSYVLLGRTEEYGGWLPTGVLVLGAGAALGLLVVHRLTRAQVAAVAAAALVTALLGPAAYSVTTVADAHTGSIVTAGPATVRDGGGPAGAGGRGGAAAGGPPGGAAGTAPGGAPAAPPGGVGTGGQDGGGTDDGRGAGGAGGLLDASTPDAEVVAALRDGADDFRWVAATVGSQSAAGLQLGTEEPVMAIGGFNGSDPSPTLEHFQAYVEAGDIHYFVGGTDARGADRGEESSGTATEITAWVTKNFTQVSIGGQTFYDLTAPSAAGTSQAGQPGP